MKYLSIILILLFLGCSNKPVNGELIYSKQCSNCHGKMGRKSAFGKSAVIGSLTKEEIVYALKGYQNGTYGGSMKKMMKKEISSFNNEEIDSVAQYISDLY